MNINKFKVGDIITRVESPKGISGGCILGQQYVGERFVFQGECDQSKMIFLIDQDKKLIQISYALRAWDKGWAIWPEKMFQEAKKNSRKTKKNSLEK